MQATKLRSVWLLNGGRNNGPSHGAFQQGHYSRTFSLSRHIPGGKWRVRECIRTSSCCGLINMCTCSRRQLQKAWAHSTMQAPEHKIPLSRLWLTDYETWLRTWLVMRFELLNFHSVAQSPKQLDILDIYISKFVWYQKYPKKHSMTVIFLCFTVHGFLKVAFIKVGMVWVGGLWG